MRSSGATKFAPPVSVVALTKSTMACLVGPSFHDGSGSWAWVVVRLARAIASRAKVLWIGFMVSLGLLAWFCCLLLLSGFSIAWKGFIRFEFDSAVEFIS